MFNAGPCISLAQRAASVLSCLAAALFLVGLVGATASAQSLPANRSPAAHLLGPCTIFGRAEAERFCERSPEFAVRNVGADRIRPGLMFGSRGEVLRPKRRKSPDPPVTFGAHTAVSGFVSPAVVSSKTAQSPTAFYPDTPQSPAYLPPTAADRARWTLKTTFGWQSLGSGAGLAAIETATNLPREWHGTWEGFGKRFGTSQAGVAISSTVEASFGAAWGEDPRYFRSGKQGIWPRTGYALKMAILARHRNGALKPAYARIVGAFGSNFATNTWRPPSDNDWQHALARSGLGLVARVAGNLFHEFWR